jgi:hypothetical protein
MGLSSLVLRTISHAEARTDPEIKSGATPVDSTPLLGCTRTSHFPIKTEAQKENGGRCSEKSHKMTRIWMSYILRWSHRTPVIAVIRDAGSPVRAH